MRRCFRLCVPMMALILLAGCGGTGEAAETADMRQPYHDMTACQMEALVSCGQEDLLWEAELSCQYVPGGETTVEVLSPETIAGVRAVLSDTDWRLEYQGDCLNAGTLSSQEISPAACLPRLMNALRDGWLLEENDEDWDGIPCRRITVDQSGLQDGKILSTVWLRLDSGAPIRGEIAVEGEIILTADFTSFSFCDTIDGNLEAAS
ncbi:MAG: hypothetical protein HDT19_05690 [Oscillibacter sp.]|nr:hypothetical protein [Oscillibacter sp.]